MKNTDRTFSGTILTPEQRPVAETDNETNLVITGPVGAGKTAVLCQRAWWLSGMTSTGPGKFRIFVPHGCQCADLNKKYRLPGMPGLTVMTINRWCEEHWKLYHLGRGLYEHLNAGNFEAIRAGVLNYIRSRGSKFKRPLLFAMVDEGQYLDPVSLEIIARSAEHVTVAVDCPNSMINPKLSLEQSCGILGIGPDRVVALPLYTGPIHVPEEGAKIRTKFSFGEGINPEKSS